MPGVKGYTRGHSPANRTAVGVGPEDPWQGKPGPLSPHDTNEPSQDFFAILSPVKNLSFKAAEIRNEAALHSE
jgi:hypothetical protein